MTGKSHIKTRVYLSDALLSPLSGRKSYNQSAIDFKGNISRSVNSPRLDANIAVKNLSIGKATSQDTDGKKRTNKGGIPGVENFGGFRYDPKAKGGPGKVFRLSTTYEDRINPTRQNPNWGWIDDPRLPENKQEEKQSDISIRMRKYKVSPRTGEVIEESGVLLDPFSVSGKPAPKEMEEKRLPGQTLSQMNPSGNLASYAARGVGVLTDMDGKLRCPPGTPAANQFTDIAGSNCFGLSSGQIIQGAKKIAGLIAQGVGELDLFNTRQTAVPTVDGPDGSKIPITGTVRNSSSFWKKFGIDVDKAGRVPWETTSGKRDYPSEVTPSEFADANKETHRIFLNGAERGRKNLRMQRERTKKALEVVGASPPSGWDKNSDLDEAFRSLTESGYVTTVFTGRPKSEKEVDAICVQVLSRRDKKAFNALPDAEKAKLIASEKERYFRAERAMMSEVLNMYISHPEHMRTIDSINWTNSFANEANANWNFVDGAFGTDSTFININMGKILENMSAYMPAVEENERLRIDARGGSEAANAQELNDFMVSTYAYSKQTAAMIGGEESFARHIMSHEIMHTMQIRALSKMIAEQVDANGAITVNGRTIKSADELSNEEIESLLNGVIRGGLNLDKFNKIMQKAEVLEHLSGRYIAEDDGGWGRGEKTLEILAELGALRAQGIIHGADIDDALAWTDSIADTRHIEDRNISDAQEMQRFENVFKGAPADLADISTLPEGAQERVKQSWADRASRYKKEFIDSLGSFSDDELVDMLGDLDLKKEISEKDLLDNPGDKKIEKEFFDIREKIREISAEWRKKTGLDNQALRRFIKANRDDNEKFDSETIRKIQAAKEKADRKNKIENVFTDEELALEYAYLSMPEDISGYTADEAEALKAEIRSGVVTRGKRDDPSQSTQKILKDFDKQVDNLVTEKFRSREIEVPGETSDDARKKVEALKISNFKESMANSTADEIVDEIGTLELQKEILKAEFNANPKDEELARKLSETEKQLKIAKSTWKDKTGLESSILKTRVAINREENNKLSEVDNLAQEVEELEKLKPATSVTPRNKLKSFESTKKLDKYADEERKHLIRQATGEEDIAIREMSDTEDSLAASLLDPDKRVDAIIAIGKNYDELISSGVSPEDANRGTEANVANQVDSILIPSLELIDKSSVPDSFEMETSFDLDEKQIAAAPDSDIIDVDGFTAGTVLHGERPIFNGPDTSGRPSATEGKTRYRVVLQVEEGQKGYFPHWSDTSSQKPEEFDQKFVMPPGKIKIVGTREEENGSTTLIAKFVEQKNVEQTLDSVLSGPDSEKIPPGARLKIEKSVNQHIVSRRQQGKHEQVKTPLTVKKEVEALNTLSIDDIGSDGGSFGFPVDSDYVEKMSDAADAPDGIDASIFGPVTTAPRRKEIRREAIDTTHSRLLSAIDSNTVDSELQIDPEDISPEVKSLIQSSTPQDIEDMVADEAMRIHSELDPRPRVIVREDELESIIDVGGLVNKSDSAVDLADDFYDIGDGTDMESGMSSGRLFGSLTNRVIQGRIKDRLDGTDLSDDQKDTIMFVTDLAGAAKFGGPKAIAIAAARRGGREVAEYAVQKLVEDGKITAEQARSAMRAVDKIAPEGVPEPVKRQLMQGIDLARDAVFTDENIDKVQDAVSGAREVIGERASSTRDTASRVLSRLRNAGGGKEKEPSVDDMLFESFSQPDDPFGENISSLKPAKLTEVTFDPFTDEPMSSSGVGSSPSRIDPNNPLAIDPFTGMPEAPQAETSRRRRRIFGRNRGGMDEQTQVPSYDPNDPFADPISAGTGLSSGADKLEQDSYPDGRFGSSSKARREEISSRAQKRIDDIGVQIEELESLNERLEKAIREFKATGTWEGEKYNVVLIEGNSPKTQGKDKLDRDEGLKLRIRQVSDSLYFNRNRKIEELKRDIKNLEGSKKRLSGDYPETTMLVDELLLDEDYLESVKARSLEVSSMSDSQRAERFTDPNDPGSVYVVHFGASKLEGGQLDPSRSRGQLDGSIGANTRQVNDLTARRMVETRDSAKRAISILEEIKRQIETDGVVDFDAIGRTDPSDLYRADAARSLLGINRRDLDYNLPTLTLDVGRVVRIDAQIADENRTLSRLDKVADQLIADDYQYSSTYRATKLADAFAGYGGRYAEGDSTEWGDNAKRSTTTGIHIFKVKIGENATEENSVGETHLVGKHTPIASLVTDSDGSRDNPAREVWEGWLDLVIEQDIAKNNKGRSGLSSGRSMGSGQADEDATIARIRSIPAIQYDVIGNRGALRSTNTSKDIQQGLASGMEGSGSIRRDLKPGSLKASPTVISSNQVEDEYGTKWSYEAQVWDIGGNKIVFGLNRKAAARDWSGEQFENIPVNPYKISGHSPDTPEGRALALKWLSAKVASKKRGTYVEALLYAASRGDSDAMDELDKLAAEGDALIAKAKPGLMDPITEYQLSEAKREGLDNLGVEDLYLVHETKYDTEQDADGNYILRPMGDYEIKGYDGKTVDAEGNPNEFYRNTLHFAVNHLAAGHLFRPRTDSGTNIIIVPLKDVLEANPGGLDVLRPEDTYLVPKPGKPLKLPNARVIRNENSETIDKEVTDVLKEMGAKKIFRGGETDSTVAQNTGLTILAMELGADSKQHSDMVHISTEKVTSKSETNFNLTAREVAQMSENERLRIANNDRWLGPKVKSESDGLFSGGTRTRRTPRTGTRTNAAVPGAINRNSTPQQGEPLVIPGIGKVSDSGVLSGIEIDSSIRRGKLKARGSGLSSGANRLALSNAQGKNVERNLSRGDLDESPVTLKSSDVVDEYRVIAKSWKIGNKNIVFGADDSTKWEGNPEFESFPINPYEISGYSETSEEGKEFARKWIFAKMQHGIESEQTGGEPTYVEALLYAAVRGDQDAAEKLNELERKGRERVEEERQTILKEWEERKASRKSAIDDEKLSDMNIDDLFVVHETTYDPQTDENGDLILRPANDYEMLDKDGNPILDEQGRPYDLYRDTIHFAVNHVVEGHMMRGSKEESNIIVVPLRSVVEANPGSLDTLYTIDTYFTPEPGKPLRLPGARVIKNTGQERIGGELSEMMKEMGGNGRTFNGGSHYSSPGADALTAEVGLELGVLAHNLHGNLPAGYYEKQRKHDKRKFSIDPYTLARMSDNSLLRVANDNRFYEIQTETTRTGRGGVA